MTTDLTTREAADYLRVSVFTIRRFLQARVLTSRKVGRGFLVDRQSLLDYERRHTTTARGERRAAA